MIRTLVFSPAKKMVLSRGAGTGGAEGAAAPPVFFLWATVNC